MKHQITKQKCPHCGGKVADLNCQGGGCYMRNYAKPLKNYSPYPPAPETTWWQDALALQSPI